VPALALYVLRQAQDEEFRGGINNLPHADDEEFRGGINNLPHAELVEARTASIQV
jgi:hypothetical protein